MCTSYLTLLNYKISAFCNVGVICIDWKEVSTCMLHSIGVLNSLYVGVGVNVRDILESLLLHDKSISEYKNTVLST